MPKENDRKIIMLVDDNAANLATGKEMLKEKYRVYPVLSGDILLDLLEDVYPDMILLDIEMPDMDGFEVMRRLKKNVKWSDIPVIFLTARSDEDSEYQGLSLGAIDYVSKPFSAPLLKKRIENHLLSQAQKRKLKHFNDNLSELVQKKISQVNHLQTTVLSTISGLVECRDDVTGGHIVRTQMYLKILVDKLLEDGIYIDEVSAWDLDFLLLSAQLHDVGKIAISDTILNKPGPLTPEEFEIMKTHVAEGIKAIRKVEGSEDDPSFLKHVRLIVGSHHEKWDGSGYPNGFKGLDIPLEGRLMAIADVYDALISKRPYKNPFSTHEACRIVEDGRDKHFDPALIDVFKKVEDKFAEVVRNSMY